MADELRAPAGLVDPFRQSRLLVIDDIGAEGLGELRQASLFNLIDRRYDTGRPTCIMANHGLSTCVQHGVLDACIASHISNDRLRLCLDRIDLRLQGKGCTIGIKVAAPKFQDRLHYWC